MSGNEAIQIDYLSEHVAAIPTLAQWFEVEWQAHYGPSGLGDARSDLLTYTNRDGLPVGVVAVCSGVLCGVAALKKDGIGTLAHLSPWVGAGFVLPHYRRRGIGTALIGFLEAVARNQGHSRIYCGTTSVHHLLLRRKWGLRETVPHGGQTVSVYEKAL